MWRNGRYRIYLRNCKTEYHVEYTYAECVTEYEYVTRSNIHETTHMYHAWYSNGSSTLSV